MQRLENLLPDAGPADTSMVRIDPQLVRDIGKADASAGFDLRMVNHPDSVIAAGIIALTTGGTYSHEKATCDRFHGKPPDFFQ